MSELFPSAYLILILILPVISFAQGGPPLLTDDPGTPGDRHWEINIAELSSTERFGGVYSFPYADINYGWGERLQLKIETGWLTANDANGVYKTGLDTALAGVKFRFFDEANSGISISTYPQIDFHHFFSTQDPELTTPGTQYILPLEFQKDWGALGVDTEVGAVLATEQSDEFFYGLACGYEFEKGREIVSEIYNQHHFDGTGTQRIFQLGTSYALSEKRSLLFSIGHTVEEFHDESGQLLTYLGLQLRI